MAASVTGARRYAEAIFEIAREQDSFVQWSGDLSAIAEFAGEPDVAQVLASNRVPRDEKLRLLEAGLAGQVGPLAMNVVRLLNDRGRLALAPDIRLRFQEMVDEERGVAHATVTTAVQLSDEERSAVATRLAQITGKQVDITAVVDEGIIGGLVARIGDQLIDGSTRSRLVALKRRLEGAAR
jgi:F-type H+-transporting ATPase subunit delta